MPKANCYYFSTTNRNYAKTKVNIEFKDDCFKKENSHLFLFKRRRQKMDENKYIEQVYRKIREQGIQNAELGAGYIDISVEGAIVFKVNHKGEMFYSSDKSISSIVDELHDKIQPIVCDVEEYCMMYS